MKMKIFYLPLFLLIIFGLVHNGCKKESENICESFDAKCEAPELATTCCSDNNCYYEYEGKRYEDTDDGKSDLIADMCSIEDDETNAGVFEIKTRLEVQTKNLMAEARASSICN